MKMSDKLTKEQRSYCMSKIKSKDTSIEIIIRKLLYKNGFRYRIHYNKLPGSPDIAFTSKKLAIFIDGDFWHGRDFNKRKDRYNEYWYKKIKTNMERDAKVDSEILSMGWKVLRLWGSEIRKNPEIEFGRIKKALDCDGNGKAPGDVHET